MFFADRIKNISTNDRVLEIGPGADPHPRSNVLLELEYATDEERKAQFGHGVGLVTDKKVVFYDGKNFPFADKEFDYVICSHVLEHVEDVPFFLSEIFRVSSKGYFEYPLIYYEYLYNFDVHLNYLKHEPGVLHYMKKNKSALDQFRPVQDLLRESLQKGYVNLVNDLLPWMMEGFEWHQPFEARETQEIAKVCHANAQLPVVKTPVPPTTMQLFKRLVRSIIK